VEKEAPSEPLHFGKYAAFAQDSANLYVLSNGYTVTSVDGTNGDSKWTWSPPDQEYVFSALKKGSCQLTILQLASHLYKTHSDS